MSKVQKTTKAEEPFTEKMQVTPTMALDWLSAVPEYQRKVDEKQVAKLAMAINRNEWKINGASIVFNEKGEVIDGQHRLHAIVKSGRTVETFVTTGVGKDELTFASLGDTKARRPQDFIHTPNVNVTAAVLRLLWFTENKMLHIGIKSGGAERKGIITSPPVAEIVKMARKHAQDISELVDPLAQTMRIIRAGSWVVFLMYYFKLYRPATEAAKVAKFFAKVGDGTELEKGNPILLLRNRCLDSRDRGLLQLPKRVREALTLKALNFYLMGQNLDRLTWAPEREPFPPLPGYDLPERKS